MHDAQACLYPGADTSQLCASCSQILIGDKRISRSVLPRRFVLRRTTVLRFGPPEDPGATIAGTRLHRLDAVAQRQLSAKCRHRCFAREGPQSSAHRTLVQRVTYTVPGIPDTRSESYIYCPRNSLKVSPAIIAANTAPMINSNRSGTEARCRGRWPMWNCTAAMAGSWDGVNAGASGRRPRPAGCSGFERTLPAKESEARAGSPR